MKNLSFTFPLVAVILTFAGMAWAAPLSSAPTSPSSDVTSQIMPMQGKGGGKPTPTPTPKPRIGPPKSGDE